MFSLKNDIPDSRLERQYEQLRHAMVTRQLAARDVTDPEVLRVMRAIPRHLFVPEEIRGQAYDDAPQPIGCGQTISQPYIVASMTQRLRLNRSDRVLEIGTGSGYQTAVLAELCDAVWTIECVPELYERAKRILGSLSYQSIRMSLGNGVLGWPQEGPFDAIIVTAAATSVPKALTDQLADNGRMIIPIESLSHENQDLILIEKRAARLIQTVLYPVRFVPLVGE